MMSFLEEINKISEEYQIHKYNQFNVFKVMFKLHDEKYLHSRFISFLLDPNGSHKQGTRFLELFLKVMGIADFSLDGVWVNPTEVKRSEVHNIDILIRNKHKQAIIIENKFFAKDQTKPEETDPFKKYQLLRYYKKIAVEEKLKVEKMIYLSIDGKKPEDFEKFLPEVEKLIDTKDHLSDIAKWLDLCLNSLSEDSDLKRSIEHYKQARFEFLNDVKLALRLKELTVTHFEEAKQFWLADRVDPKLQIVQEQFKHVKWHTVYDFYAKLKEVIEVTFGTKLDDIDKEQITKLTHHDKKNAILLTFEINGIIYYVCNDKNGFSIGRHIEPKTDNDFIILFKGKNYKKFDSFELMIPQNNHLLIAKIVESLKEFVKS